MSAPVLNRPRDVHDAYLNLALAYQYNRDYREAVAVLRKAARLYSSSGTIQIALGLNLLELGDDPGATTAFKRAVRHSAEADVEVRAAGYLGLANIYRKQGQHKAAVETLQDAFRHGLSRVALLQPLCDSLVQCARYEEALDAIDQLLQMDVKLEEVFEMKTLCLHNLGRYEESLAVYEKVLERRYLEPAQLGLAQCLRRLGRIREALHAVEFLLKRQPQHRDAKLVRAELLVDLGNYDQAVAVFESFSEQTPATHSVGILKVEALIAGGRAEDALAVLTKLLDDVPDPRAFLYRAWIRVQSHQYKEALSDLDQALAAGVQPAGSTLLLRGNVRERLGDFDAALEDYVHAIDVDPKDHTAMALVGELHRKLGAYEEALSAFDRSIALNSNEPWTLASRGETYRSSRRFADAKRDLDSALTRDPKQAWVLSARAELYIWTGQFAEAIRDLMQALCGEPETDWYIYLRGLAKIGLGNADDAMADFLEAARIARKEQVENPQNHANNFELGLYAFALGNPKEGLNEYRSTLLRAPLKTQIIKAALDLETFLHVCPDFEAAQMARGWLNEAS
jgi:tetratricopeptide (TPR) repeat protein